MNTDRVSVLANFPPDTNLISWLKLYGVSIVVVMALWLGGMVALLAPITAEDVVAAFAVAIGILALPMAFVWGLGRVVGQQTQAGSGKKWTRMLAYSAVVLGGWLLLFVFGRGVGIGTSEAWLLTLATILSYSAYLLLAVAALAATIALGGMLMNRMRTS